MRIRNLLLATTTPHLPLIAEGWADMRIEGEGEGDAGGSLLMDQGGGEGDDPPAQDPLAGDPPAEDKPAEDPPAEDKPAEDPPADEGAPEEYADFSAPEGVTLDADTLAAFKVEAKALNLPQGKAQQLVDMAAGLMQKQADAFVAQIEETTTAWREASSSDAEFGGKKLTESLKVAAKARDTFASPELVKFLKSSKMGDHPEMIRLFWKIGQAISEDSTVLPGKPATEKPFYDHPTSKAKTA